MDFLASALNLVPALIRAGQAVSEVKDFATWAYQAGTKKDGPNDDDWAQLHAKEDAFRAHLNAPAGE
jgi:hypothetical protein